MSRENNSSRISNDKSSSRKDRLLNFIYNSNNRLLKKDFPEKENNSEKISLSSLKKEIIYKLTSFSQEDRSVQFSPGIEEIECESRNDIDENDSFFMKLSNKKKFSTPPKKMKSSYKKTKEHIKTPYKTTKSRSTKNKSKNTNDININNNNNKSNVSTKSSYYWKSLLDNENMILKNLTQGNEVEINRLCNSVILENPFMVQKEFKKIFYNFSLEDNDEDLNKSY